MYLQLSRKFSLKCYKHIVLPLSTVPSSSGTFIQKGVLPSNQEKFHYLISSHRSLKTSSVCCNKDTSLMEKVKEELSVFRNVDFNELKSAPFPAIVYGFGGIVPFVFPPLYFILGSYSPFLATSQLLYGATILAFVGGVKWGNALAKDNISHNQMGISTIPSLVAWGSLLIPEPLGFLVVSSGLVGALYVDITSSRYPSWFLALRSTLTGFAVTSLLITCFCHILH